MSETTFHEWPLAIHTGAFFSLMHSVAPLVLGLFVACLVTLSCNTSDVLIESFELLLILDLLFMILSRYSFQYVVFKVRGTPQARLLSANGDGDIRTLDPLLARQVLSQLSYTPIGCGSTLLRQSLFSFAWFDLTKPNSYGPFLFFKSLYPNGLKWTRTTDLTLIRRAL